MTINEKVKVEKRQYNINNKTAKNISIVIRTC